MLPQLLKSGDACQRPRKADEGGRHPRSVLPMAQLLSVLSWGLRRCQPVSPGVARAGDAPAAPLRAAAERMGWEGQQLAWSNMATAQPTHLRGCPKESGDFRACRSQRGQWGRKKRARAMQAAQGEPGELWSNWWPEGLCQLGGPSLRDRAGLFAMQNPPAPIPTTP